MNTKTLISTLALTLALGTLALPGTAAARDYDRGDRQEQSHQRHGDQHRDRHNNRRGDDRRDHRNHNRGRPDHIGYQGRGRWVPYIPQYNRHYRDYGHRYGHHKHGRAVLTRGHNHYYTPLPIIRIVTQW